MLGERSHAVRRYTTLDDHSDVKSVTEMTHQKSREECQTRFKEQVGRERCETTDVGCGVPRTLLTRLARY